jgi:DNA polymerase III subunit delta
MNHQKIIQQIRNRVFHPVYFLHGEEPYYIDLIAKVIEKEVLDEGEKEFNQTVLYGSDTDAMQLMTVARRFPMMASHMVVVVREAQMIKDFLPLAPYFSNPLSSTLLVFCYKHKKPDKELKPILKELAKRGLVYESAKIRDYLLPDWIRSYVRDRQFMVTEKSCMLLSEYLGNDLSKISNELEKLFIGLPAGTTITEELIERNIGISKDFNVFELQKAIGARNVAKANQIIFYMANNPKEHPLQMLLPVLYGYFSKLLKIHYADTKDRTKLAVVLGVHPYFITEYLTAKGNYPVQKLIRIVAYLRECDVRSKGLNGCSVPHGELLKELLFKIMH